MFLFTNIGDKQKHRNTNFTFFVSFLLKYLVEIKTRLIFVIVRRLYSRLVLAACPIRTDLLVPNELYRCKDTGNIKGCQSFSIN